MKRKLPRSNRELQATKSIALFLNIVDLVLLMGLRFPLTMTIGLSGNEERLVQILGRPPSVASFVRMRQSCCFDAMLLPAQVQSSRSSVPTENEKLCLLSVTKWLGLKSSYRLRSTVETKSSLQKSNLVDSTLKFLCQCGWGKRSDSVMLRWRKLQR